MSDVSNHVIHTMKKEGIICDVNFGGSCRIK